MNTSVHKIEITGLAKEGGPLTKRITLTPDGSLHSDGSACVMTDGQARRVNFDNLEEFGNYIAGLERNEAIALGALKGEFERVDVVTKDHLERLRQGGLSIPGCR
jgi:hypothetical protein